MGSHAISPQEMRAYAQNAKNEAQEMRLRYEQYLITKSDYEDKKTKFIDGVVNNQSESSLSRIRELNQKQDTVQRVGLLTEGEINGSPVCLSIDSDGNFIYDVLKKDKCLSMFIKKDIHNFLPAVGFEYELDLISKNERVTYASSTVFLDNLKPDEMNYLPEEAVRKMSSKYNTGFNKEQSKKLNTFMDTYLFAGTNPKETKQEWEKIKLEQSTKKGEEQKTSGKKEKEQKAQNMEKPEKFVKDFETEKFRLNFLINKFVNFRK